MHFARPAYAPRYACVSKQINLFQGKKYPHQTPPQYVSYKCDRQKVTLFDKDLIVDIDSTDPLIYADNYFNLKFALEDLFKRNVDLLENKAIKNQYIRDNIEQAKKLIYGS